jgi:hypothetical protein
MRHGMGRQSTKVSFKHPSAKVDTDGPLGPELSYRKVMHR